MPFMYFMVDISYSSLKNKEFYNHEEHEGLEG